ncbi:hypothetical protein [Tenggerimyces flavus]|uniref:Uncharacterized protein n=1 Tax=Tenggerimyces flavus TaxID=1708749 RepID=A0ABV7YA89_9ACTN|nr:hypothetical protein [Tenggerimyces flavus]MBM7788889.1 hypothetical protein [Tenggerimyces flavus]
MPKHTDDEAEGVPVRPFAAVLQDLGRGEVMDQAGAMLQDLVQGVLSYGKAGVFTLKVKVAPMKGQPDGLLVTAVADAKPPVGDPTSAVFFADEHGNLLRDDPNQPKLPFREASQTVNLRTGEVKG